MSAAMFEFDFIYIARDLTGYYYARWDRAKPITVRGRTKQEAINKADEMLGECPRGYGWEWVFKTMAIREITEPAASGREGVQR